MRRKKKSEDSGFNVWRSYSDMMAGVLLLFYSDHVCELFFRHRKATTKVFRSVMKRLLFRKNTIRNCLDKQNALDEKDESPFRVRMNS